MKQSIITLIKYSAIKSLKNQLIDCHENFSNFLAMTRWIALRHCKE
ncbi:hypothetical protein [Helicobacter rodentium]|nr:hypothetical protein [Helicobacter rodentium]